ncbi:MAG: hypothetical protein WCI53_11590 [Bacteroidota bacterium]
MSDFLKVENPFIESLFDEFYAVKEKQNSIQYKYEGNNQERFVFLIDNVLKDSEMILLNNIIQSGLKLKIEDVAILNLSIQNGNAKISDVIISLMPLKMIVWGCDEWIKKEGWNIPLHEFANIRSTRVFKADVIEKYNADKELKLKLWNLGIKKLVL